MHPGNSVREPRLWCKPPACGAACPRQAHEKSAHRRTRTMLAVNASGYHEPDEEGGRRRPTTRVEVAMNNTAVAALLTAVVIMSLVAWLDSRCLADLARTSDRDLHIFNRNTWALLIVVSFPIGPMLYLMYAKGPRRYR